VLAVGGLGLVFGAVVFRLMAGDLMNTGFRYLLPVMLPALLGFWLLLVNLSGMIHRLWQGRGRLLATPGLALLMLVPVPMMPVVLEAGSLFRGNTNAPRSRLLNRLVEPSSYDLATRWQWFFSDPMYINADAGRWVAENLPPNAILAADQVGQFSFYTHPDQIIVDVLGLTNRHIARHGLTAEYLRGRGVDWLVIETRLDMTLWPRDWRLKPSVPVLQEALSREEFRSTYRPRWLLRSRVPLLGVGFMVHVSPEVDDGLPLEEVFIGLDAETFEKFWRVGEKVEG
jgi:hypothetical protein